MTIRTLLVDDEPLALERIRNLLSPIKNVSVIGECSSGSEAVITITREKPDLVFLDINIPDLDGFEILSELTAESVELPLIIFQTAFDHHAIRAFEVNAVDYLLKPFRRQRIEESIEKARKLLEAGALNDQSSQLHQWLADERDRRTENRSNYLHKIEIRDRGETFYLPVEEIEYFQADGNYIEIHTPTKEHLWRQTLGKLEGNLDPTRFIRISRSVIIPLDKVSSIESPTRGDARVKLDSGERLSLTRNLSELKKLLTSS